MNGPAKSLEACSVHSATCRLNEPHRAKDSEHLDCNRYAEKRPGAGIMLLSPKVDFGVCHRSLFC